MTEQEIEQSLIGKLGDLKYTYRQDIRDRAALENNFREKFEALNRVSLTASEFQRLLEEIVTPDVFTAARTLRERNSFMRTGKEHHHLQLGAHEHAAARGEGFGVRDLPRRHAD